MQVQKESVRFTKQSSDWQLPFSLLFNGLRYLTGNYIQLIGGLARKSNNREACAACSEGKCETVVPPPSSRTIYPCPPSHPEQRTSLLLFPAAPYTLLATSPASKFCPLGDTCRSPHRISSDRETTASWCFGRMWSLHQSMDRRRALQGFEMLKTGS